MSDDDDRARDRLALARRLSMATVWLNVFIPLAIATLRWAEVVAPGMWGLPFAALMGHAIGRVAWWAAIVVGEWLAGPE